jgi:hypothetical protein
MKATTFAIVVWVALILNDYGVTRYEAETESELYAKVAYYCRQWWQTEHVLDDLTEPTDDREAVELFFKWVSEEALVVAEFPDQAKVEQHMRQIQIQGENE